jgi:hypothetical protein
MVSYPFNRRLATGFSSENSKKPAVFGGGARLFGGKRGSFRGDLY